MKSISTLQQAQAAINEILNRLDTLCVKNWDRKQTRIVNAHPSVDDYDYIVRKELDARIGVGISQTVQTSVTATVTLDKCTFGLGVNSLVTVGTNVCPPYICARPLLAKFTLAAIGTPSSGGPIQVNLRLLGANIFYTPLVIPAGSTAVVEKSDYAIVSFAKYDIITCDVLQVGNESPGTNLVIVTVFE